MKSKRPNFGVMIARGDLAVEIGFERISEVQNQILWLCEAAHIPDAAMSSQAECVMLNKGPFILETVRKLKVILIKMQAHSNKKKSSLRALNVAKIDLEKLEPFE